MENPEISLTEQPIDAETLRAIEQAPKSAGAPSSPRELPATVSEPFLRRTAIVTMLGGSPPTPRIDAEERARQALQQDIATIQAAGDTVELPYDIPDIREDVTKYNAGQPRDPAGSPTGGQWTAQQLMHEQLSGPKGSNPGGVYRGTDGVKRYIKQYSDPTQAYGEKLANQIYRDLGFAAPSSLVTEGDGWTLHAAELVGGHTQLGSAGLTMDRAREILQGFPVDVLTANWDAVGMGHDNVLVKPGSPLLRVDQGGAFLMRAQAGRKPEALLNKATEWEGFAPGGVNPWYAKVFTAAGTTPDQLDIKPVVQKILALRGEGWSSYVRQHTPGLKAADQAAISMMLEMRTTFLAKKAGLVLKFDTAQAREPAGTPDGGQWTKNGFDRGFVDNDAALAWYTRDGNVFVNNYLRHGKDGSPRVKAAIEILDQHTKIGQPLTRDKVVYRGITGNAARMFTEASPGAVIEDDGYVSVTEDIRTANYFAHLHHYDRDTKAVVEVELPAGTRWGPGDEAEREMILPRGARFEKVEELAPLPKKVLPNSFIPADVHRIRLRYLGSSVVDDGFRGQINPLTGEPFRKEDAPDRFTWHEDDVRVIPPRRVEKEQPREPAGTPEGGQWASSRISAREKIVAAASKNLTNGEIFTGVIHGESDNLLDDAALRDNIPRRVEHGFMTSTGRFVDREEAAKIALRHQQIARSEDHWNTENSGILYSEHLELQKGLLFVRKSKEQPRAPAGTPEGGQWISTGMGQTTPEGSDLHDPSASVRWRLSAEDPPELNGIPFSPYVPPKDWRRTAGQHPVSEPELVGPEREEYVWSKEKNRLVPTGKLYTKPLSAGAIIQEPDGRVWLLEPYNHFGGYQQTFPKGGVEEGLSLQQTAIKEVWEEIGLKVEITGHAFDQERDTSMTRYYWATRTGGTPTDFGEETHAVHLVPVAHLHRYLNRENDRKLAATVLKAPMPPRARPTSPWKGPGSPAAAKSPTEGRPTSPWLPKGVLDPSRQHWWEKPRNLFDRFKKSILETVLKYNSNQPRDPKGLPTGGQWASVGIAPPANVLGEGFPGKPTGLHPEKHKAQINKLAKLEKLAMAGKLEELKATYVAMSAEKKYKEALVNHLEIQHTQHYLEQAGLPKMPTGPSTWTMKQMKTLAAHALSDLDPATAFDHLDQHMKSVGYLYDSSKAYGEALGAALTEKMAAAAQHLPPAPPTVMTNGKPLTPGIQLKLAQLHGALAGKSPAEAIDALNKITVGMPTTMDYKTQLFEHLNMVMAAPKSQHPSLQSLSPENKKAVTEVIGDSAMTSVLYPKPIPEVGQAMHDAILAALPDPTKESPSGMPSTVVEGSQIHEMWQKATAPALTLAEKITSVQAMGLALGPEGGQYTQEVLSTLTGLIGQKPNMSPQLATILKPFPQPGWIIETPADVGGQHNLDQMHQMLKIANAAHFKGTADAYTDAMNTVAAIDASSNATMKQYKDTLMKSLWAKANVAMGKSPGPPPYSSPSYTGGAFATKGIAFPPKPHTGLSWVDAEIETVHAQVNNADTVQQAIDNLKENTFTDSVGATAYKGQLLTVLENHKLATEVGAPQGMTPAQLQNIKNAVVSPGLVGTHYTESVLDNSAMPGPKPPKAPIQTGTSAGSLWVQNKIQQLTLASNSSDPVNSINAVSMTKTAPKFLKSYKDQLLQYHQTVGTKAGFAQPAPSSGLAQKVSAVKPKLPPLPEAPPVNTQKYTPEQQAVYTQKVAALKAAAAGPNPLAAIDTIQGASGAIQTYKSALINHIMAHAPVPDAVVGQTVSSYKIVSEHALPQPPKFTPSSSTELGHLEYYRHNLPKLQKDAVGFYKGSGYQALNAHRFNPGAALPSNHKHLDAALFNAPGLPRDILLTRRISSKSLAAIAKSLEGKIFTDPAYGSTAYTEGTWHGNVVLKINAPKGTKGIFFASESEWLLPRNTRYRVFKVEQLAGGETRIHTELLPVHEQVEWPSG